MNSIPIFELQQVLEPVLGITGARRQIVGALYRGDIRARCKSFVGVNASDHTSGAYPEAAEDFDLPPVFWSLSAWVDDGERPGADPGDRTAWSTQTSWARGDFAVSGSRGRSAAPVLRRAVGVSIFRAEVRAFLKQFGVAMPGGSEEMTSWATGWIRDRLARGEPYGERKMTPPFLDQFPRAHRKEIRSFHAEAKRILNI